MKHCLDPEVYLFCIFRRVVLLTFTFALLVPQIFILSRDTTTRYCGQPLFELLITCIVFTFCMIGKCPKELIHCIRILILLSMILVQRNLLCHRVLNLTEFVVNRPTALLCFIEGFSFLFSIMDPVPWEVKLAFHIFGGIVFILGLVQTAFTSLAGECVRIYYISSVSDTFSKKKIPTVNVCVYLHFFREHLQLSCITSLWQFPYSAF